MDNGGSVPQGNDSQTKRSEIDQDVERAFDLLRDYQSFLCKQGVTLPEQDINQAIGGLEDVMRQWLPRAASAQDTLINDVYAAIGNREAAKQLLAGVKLWPARKACLASVARAIIPPTLSASRATATCRQELLHWRELLPMIRRGPNEVRYVEPSDVQAARYVGWYWSANLESRPSKLGASYFLAAACDAVAAAARQQGLPVESIRPALRLAQRLRDNPDWTLVDGPEVVQVIDEQAALAREVQDLLAEIDLGSVKPSPTGDYGGAGDARRLLHDAVTSISGSRPERVLKFPRSPDAKRKCLEALAIAPAGIPTHQNIADAVDLELQTVKEIMLVLKNAGFVEKVEAAWTITDKGREHLKALRGE